MVDPDDPDPTPGPDPTPQPSPESEPDSNLNVAFNAESYNFSTSTSTLRATLTKTEGDITTEDRENWSIVDPSGQLEQSGNITVSTKGAISTTIKRTNPLSFASGVVIMKLMHNNATYATISVTYSPSATIITDNSVKLITDGPENITTLKINGTEVPLENYVITSDTPEIATIENNVVTPLTGGQAIFNISPVTDSSLVAQAKITFYEPVAKVGDNYYKTLSAAFKAAPSGSTITMENDATESISFSGTAPRPQEYELTLDLNGHTLTGSPSSSYSLRVDYGTVTVKDSVGTGSIVYGKDYAIIVSHLAGDYPSKLILENGNYIGKTSVAQVGTPGGTGANYKYYGGELVIKDGTFTAIPDTNETYDTNGNFKYALNMLDMNESNYAGGIYSPSSISVEGGRFYKFDPSNNSAEGPNTNFVAEGFTSVQDGDWYEVRES